MILKYSFGKCQASIEWLKVCIYNVSIEWFPYLQNNGTSYVCFCYLTVGFIIHELFVLV